MPLRWTEEELEAYQEKKRLTGYPIETLEDLRRAEAWELENAKKPKPHKYRAEPIVVDGIRFDSKLEARYYERLKLRQAAGEVVGFLRQVPIHLPGKTKLVVDFLEFRPNDLGPAWSVYPVFVDTKGVETETFRLKVRQVRELYPWIQLEIVRRVS